MMEAIEDEINELEEIIASFMAKDEESSNAALVAELRIELNRLKGKLHHARQHTFSMGGEVPS